MQPSQRYMLTIHDLFTMRGGVLCGAEAEVAILDGSVEVERVKFSGKCQSKGGYSRSYYGKSGLEATLVSGPGKIDFDLAQSVAI